TDITVGSHPNGVAVTPDGKTAFVTNFGGNSVSTIDVKTRTKDPTDIPVGLVPGGVAFSPDGKTAFVTHQSTATLSTIDLTAGGTAPSCRHVSTIDLKTRTQDPTHLPVGSSAVALGPVGVAVTPNGTTAFVANPGSGTVSTIDVKTRTKDPTDIAVGSMPVQ